MLGIIWNVNELLQGAEGKKPVEEKIKVIRSLDALIRRIGVTMATFSQQVSCRSSLRVVSYPSRPD
jgi:hypothetical protein